MMMAVGFILTVIVSYGLGSIPFGFLITKYMAGINIREHGSKNIGATNVMRVVGKKLGLITLILDGLKGLLAVWVGFAFGDIGLASIAGVTVVMGHIYPYWLQFKGGKGVATAFAVYLGLYPPLAALAALCWLVVFYISKISSLSSILAMIFTFALSWVFAPNAACLAITIINAMVIYRHKDNIIRLLKGEEKPL